MLYFDNAATTFPKPKSVINAVTSALINYGGNPGRGGHNMAMRVSEKIFSIRKIVAEFFNADIENVAFTQNCTMSLNIAIKGVLNSGDHILCSCLEHNSVIRPIVKLYNDGKITYDIAKVYDNDIDTINSFKLLIKENTKAIVCTHASNVSGKKMPIKQLGKLCKDNGLIFIVDAAQTAGVFPIDMQDFNINILCMPGHKSLYGITGSGIIILNHIAKINTILEGGTGSVSVELVQPDFCPDRLEAGTSNTAGIFSIGAGINFIHQIGLDNIYSHEYKLCEYVYNKLSKIENIKLYTKNYKAGQNAPIISFNIGNENSDNIVGTLNNMNCALRGGLHCSPLAHEYYGTLDIGMARFSPSIFTKEYEVEQFVRNIQIISKNKSI
ncbi:MAG: aminotransferase class V-fold PLP-dependent enzyme [Oscillospiraceae bacterium]